MSKTHAKHANGIDKAIGAIIGRTRISLGLTRKELADQIGVTHQQLQKYECGTNRIAASRLYVLAKTLNVMPALFFEEIETGIAPITEAHQRTCMEVLRDYVRIQEKGQQDAIRRLIATLAERG